MSQTAARPAKGARSSHVGWPIMPALVVLTRRRAARRRGPIVPAARRESCGTAGLQHTAPAWPRACRLRLRIWICAAPSSSSASNAARAAPPAPSSTAFCRVQARAKISRKDAVRPICIGVAPFDPPIVVEDQQIGGAGGLRGRIAVMGQAKGGFLVRHRDIDAAKACLRAARDDGGKIFRRRPAAPARRRCQIPSANSHAAPARGNGHRPADDARQACLIAAQHIPSAPSQRRQHRQQRQSQHREIIAFDSRKAARRALQNDSRPPTESSASPSAAR